MKLTIKITKEVLEKTMRCSSYKTNQNCGIAYAVRLLFPDARVWLDRIVFGECDELFDPELVFAMLPSSAILFIGEFDSLRCLPQKRLLLPEFSFTIDVPDSVIESIGIEEAKAIIEKSSTLELA